MSYTDNLFSPCDNASRAFCLLYLRKVPHILLALAILPTTYHSQELFYPLAGLLCFSLLSPSGCKSQDGYVTDLPVLLTAKSSELIAALDSDG